MEKREKRREQALERIGSVKSEVGVRNDIKEEPATPETADSPVVVQVRTQRYKNSLVWCSFGCWVTQILVAVANRNPFEGCVACFLLIKKLCD